MYDLDNTGYIERGEVQRFLVALLKDNPAIDLDDMQLNAIIDQVGRCHGLLAGQCPVCSTPNTRNRRTHECAGMTCSHWLWLPDHGTGTSVRGCIAPSCLHCI